jgi:hypothetical protein
MLIEARPIAVCCAVLFFFGNAIIGMVSGVSVPTCTQRSCLAAFVAYVVAKGLIKVVNAILVKAVINHVILENERRAANENG